jgi:RNA polymerase sigma factor (TIGR02999 family)
MARERAGHILQTTALVNEVYLRLVDTSKVAWQDRAYFFAIAAKLMRQALVEFARNQRRLKRGAGAQQVSLSQALDTPDKQDIDLIALDNALTALAAINARQAKVVELRFFGGLTEAETAEVLQVSMLEMPHPGENHRQFMFIRRLDHFLVPH